MTKFIEVSHLYLGCEVANSLTGRHGLLFEVVRGRDLDNIKPILRPLSDMTDEEALKCGEILGGMSHLSNDSIIHQIKDLIGTNKLYTMQTNISGIKWIYLTPFLLKQSFDIFGLIESGEAINKTTL